MKELHVRLTEEFKDPEYAHAYVEEFLNIYIATQIKVLREQRGWTQAQLAERAGMRQERISVLENVNYEKWSISTLKKLARAFDLSLKLSFESFTDLIDDIVKFNRESLEKDERESDLTRTEEIQWILDFGHGKRSDVLQARILIESASVGSNENTFGINDVDKFIENNVAMEQRISHG